MATIMSNDQFIQSQLNLNLIYANTYDSGLFKNINQSLLGVTYKDAYEADYYAGYYGSAVFAGTGLTQNSSGAITGGTVTGYFELYYDGYSYVPFLAIQNISISAKSLYNAAKTPSTSDDISLINSALTKADTFILSDYDDSANGFAGNDTMYGYAGDDTLTGGAGQDYLSGGDGYNTFVFNAVGDSANSTTTCDLITDFWDGYDTLDLSAIDASTKISGNNSFVFNGTTAFGTSKSGEVYYRQFDNANDSNDYTLVYIDNDSDAASEAIIKLAGLVDLTAYDFYL